MNKSGQVAILIIIGVIIAASVILFFILSRSPSQIDPTNPDLGIDINSYIQECVAPSVTRAADLMMERGGFIEPKNKVIFNGLPVEYLCLNKGNFEPCIHQHPVFLNEIKREIYRYIYPEVGRCFEQLNEEYKERNIQSDFISDFEFSVELQNDLIVIPINRVSRLEGFGSNGISDDVTVEVENPIYNLARIAMEIANQEATYCYFEYLGYNLFYPRYEITEFSMSDATNIYTIKDLKSEKEMRIAIRSCAISPGAG